MRKVVAILALVALLLCGCARRQDALIGTWVLIGSDGGVFGYALEFDDDGAMRCTPGLDGSSRNLDAELLRMEDYFHLRYRIRGGGTVRVTMTALFATVEQDFSYSIENDVLVFDGCTYKKT